MPHPTSRILLATDFSEGAQAAAQMAVEYSRRLGVPLDVLHVTHRGGEEEALHRLTANLARFHGTEAKAVVESGSPSERILHYAKLHDIELIVVGSHGYTGFTTALLGSVAERLVRTAPCPVLAVPRTAWRRSFSAGPAGEDIGALQLPEDRACLVCQVPCDELICESCRMRIRAESLHRRQEEFRNLPL
jgi:nucleotide-binding universal stress UspA family protein